MVFKPYITKRSAEIPLRTALYGRLSAALAPTLVFNGDAPPNQAFPYVTIGESVDGPDIGTKTSEADNLEIMFHCNTEEVGSFDGVNTLKSQVLQALTLPIQITGNWNLYSVEKLSGKTYCFDKIHPTAAFYIRFKLQDTLNV